jgi:hypothetical protein
MLLTKAGIKTKYGSHYTLNKRQNVKRLTPKNPLSYQNLTSGQENTSNSVKNTIISGMDFGNSNSTVGTFSQIWGNSAPNPHRVKDHRMGYPHSHDKQPRHLYEFARDALEAAQNETTRTPVATAECKALHKFFYTKRKKDLIEYGDSGKAAYFSVQIENEGKKGPWGPLVSALIP